MSNISSLAVIGKNTKLGEGVEVEDLRECQLRKPRGVVHELGRILLVIEVYYRLDLAQPVSDVLLNVFGSERFSGGGPTARWQLSPRRPGNGPA